MNKIGLYIHVPFCASKCGYCDFYSRVRPDLIAPYIAALKEELRRWEGRGLQADTLFFGGGTPSLLPPREVGALISLCRRIFSLGAEAEVTLEANPDTVSLESLAGYRRAGVNRLSMGMQSAVAKELRLLARSHSPEAVKLAVGAAREAGFDNLSLDLMLGLPRQTMDSLKYSLEAATALNPEHLPCYILKIEKNTAFNRRLMQRYCPSDDLTADFYLAVSHFLQEHGYAHYEISNFAQPGRESLHNLKYWRSEDYLGFGPAAHSCFAGQRFFHPADVVQYINTKGQDRIADGPAGSAEERLMLALRLAEGVCPQNLPDSFDWADFISRCAPYEKGGLMARTDAGGIRLTERGFLLSNSILANLL